VASTGSLIESKLYAGNPVEVSALSNPRSRGFARARHAAALILLGGCLLGSNLARADEVAPTINLSQSQFTLYQNGLSSQRFPASYFCDIDF
jgi:hypothetical protein